MHIKKHLGFAALRGTISERLRQIADNRHPILVGTTSSTVKGLEDFRSKANAVSELEVKYANSCLYAQTVGYAVTKVTFGIVGFIGGAGVGVMPALGIAEGVYAGINLIPGTICAGLTLVAGTAKIGVDKFQQYLLVDSLFKLRSDLDVTHHFYSTFMSGIRNLIPGQNLLYSANMSVGRPITETLYFDPSEMNKVAEATLGINNPEVNEGRARIFAKGQGKR